MDQERIDTYSRILDELGIDHEISDAFLDFLETYDGTNTEDLENMVNIFMVFFYSHALLKNKADAYDMLELNHQDFMDSVENIKKDFEALQQGKYPYRGKVSLKPDIEKDLEQDEQNVE